MRGKTEGDFYSLKVKARGYRRQWHEVSEPASCRTLDFRSFWTQWCGSRAIRAKEGPPILWRGMGSGRAGLEQKDLSQQP